MPTSVTESARNPLLPIAAISEEAPNLLYLHDDKILSLYAKGMTTLEIVAPFKEIYGADVSPALISKVTHAVIEQVIEWQSHPLHAVYPIVYLDCIVVKIRRDKQAISKAIYLALRVTMEGQKELLGLWLSEN